MAVYSFLAVKYDRKKAKMTYTYMTDEINLFQDNIDHSIQEQLTRSRSFSETDQFNHLKLTQSPIQTIDSKERIDKSCLFPGRNSPQLPQPNRKRAFSEAELHSRFVELVKNYKDFTPLKDKNDPISKKLKSVIIQREISNITSKINAVDINTQDHMEQ